MQETSYGVLLFDSTQAALRAEKILKAEGLTVKLIPVPRQLSSDCGISLRFPFAQVDVVEATLAAKGLPVAGIHRL